MKTQQKNRRSKTQLTPQQETTQAEALEKHEFLDQAHIKGTILQVNRHPHRRLEKGRHDTVPTLPRKHTLPLSKQHHLAAAIYGS